MAPPPGDDQIWGRYFQVQWSDDGSNFITIDNIQVVAPTGSISPEYHYTDVSPLIGINKVNYYRIVEAFKPDGAYDGSPGYYHVPLDSDPVKSLPSEVVHTAFVAAPIVVNDIVGDVGTEDAESPYSTAVGKDIGFGSAPSILSDDYDPQGLTLKVASYTSTSHGNLYVDPVTGDFSYDPNPGFSGIDSFTYIATNGTVKSDSVEVDIQVANKPIVTEPDSIQVPANRSSPISTTDLAANDSNPDNADVTYSLVPGDDGPAHGTVIWDSLLEQFIYTPNTGYSGLDHFQYEVSDGTQISNPSTVVLSVGTTLYNPPVPPTNPVTKVPPQLNTFPNSLKGVWDSWQASEDRLQQLVVTIQNFGKAAAACKTIDKATAGSTAASQLIDTALALQDLVTQAYDSYSQQAQATVRLLGDYLRPIHYPTADDFEVSNAVSALPLTVLNIGPSMDQLAKYRSAFENLANGTDFMVANADFDVEVAKDTHDALQQTIQDVGVISIAATGAELLAEEGCAKFVQYAMQQMVNTAAGVVTGYISQSAVALAGRFTGINPDYLRIGADSMQLFFMVKAARAEKLAQGANCFAGDTTVQTASGGEAIDQIQDGDRVLTSVAETPDQGGPVASDTSPTAVDPATWRQVDLTMPDPANANDSYTMQLLEPLSWITANSAAVGNWISLDLPELQISGEAQVDSINPCPTIESGPGQVVLGTFQHVSNDVVDVNLAGESQPLQVTAGHLLWSLDADGWVVAGDLHAGERLAGENGPVTIESVTPYSQSMTVYNLDVENDHRYLVTNLGVLSHNVDLCSYELNGVQNTWGYEPAAGLDEIENAYGAQLNNFASVGSLGEIESIEGFDQPIPGGVTEPDYRVKWQDGTQGYADLYRPETESFNTIASEIRSKANDQTQGGVVIVALKGIASDDQIRVAQAAARFAVGKAGFAGKGVIIMVGQAISAKLFTS